MKMTVETLYDIKELDHRITVWFDVDGGKYVTDVRAEQELGITDEENLENLITFLRVIGNTVEKYS